MKTKRAQHRIGTVATELGLESSTLRYYEKEGLISSHRDRHQIRYYDDEDKEWIAFLLYLKRTGMSIKELKQYVSLRNNGNQTIPQRINLLKKVQERVQSEIKKKQANLVILTHKINWYKSITKNNNQESFKNYLKKVNNIKGN